MSPTYGMTELPMLISRARSGTRSLAIDREALDRGIVRAAAGPSAVDVVSNGPSVARTEVKIVDPHALVEVAPGHVGEIWARTAPGAAIPRTARGYWQKPEETAATFHATLAGDDGGPYLRTGDLGFLADGEVFITGRHKDLIIVRGRNTYPNDLETTARAVDPRLVGSASAAFAVPGADGDGVALVHEVPDVLAADPEQHAALLEKIRRRLVEEHRVQPVLLALARALTLPRTPTRKISRSATRTAALAKTLPLVAEWRADQVTSTPQVTTAIADPEAWLVARIVAMTNAPASTITPDLAIAACGVDSLGLVQLVDEIEATFGVAMPQAIRFATEKISTVAAKIRDGGGPRAHSSLVDAAVLPATFAVTPRVREGSLRAILLTGVTGFVGAFLARTLLDRTTARLHVLVRAADPAAGMARVRITFAGYGLAVDDLDDRVEVWIGDIAEPLLGLEADRFAALARTVDTIFHGAAMLNFVYRYSDLEAANVAGTRTILELAAQSGAAVHHLSTIGVFPFTERGTAFSEDDVPDPAGLVTGYARSKWVAEGLVRDAGRRGLPVSIYRLGEVIGDSRTGTCRIQDDLFALLLRAMHRLGAYEAGRRGAHLMVPVDYVAEAIVALAQTAVGATHHLVLPLAEDSAAGDVWSVVGAARALSREDWIAKFRRELAGQQPYAPLAPFIEQMFAPTTRLLVDSQRTRAAIGDRVPLPALATSLAAYHAYLDERGFFRA